MYSFMPIVLAALLFFTQEKLLSQASGPRTLVAVLAHADDEDPARAHTRPLCARGRAGPSADRERWRAGHRIRRRARGYRKPARSGSCVCVLKKRGAQRRRWA